MAATVDSTAFGPFGVGGNLNLSLKYLDLGTYATGGIAVTSTILGTGPIVDLIPIAADGYVPDWTGTNILVRQTGTATESLLTEVATGTSLATPSFPVLCFTRP